MELPEELAVSQGVDEKNSSAPSFNIYALSSPTIDKFRHQFEALGLIFADYISIGNVEGVPRSGYVWTLTEKGRKYIAQSLAQKATSE